MGILEETSRVYSYPSRVAKIGTDLVLTSKDFFVILTDEDITKIQQFVIKEGKSLLLQNGSLYVYNKEHHVIIEVMRNEDFKRTLMVNISVFS
jgi:hypothetical protein